MISTHAQVRNLYLFRAQLLFSRPSEEYSEFCEKILSEVAGPDKISDSLLVVSTCTLFEDALSDYVAAIELARKMVDADSNNEQYLHALGAILMRADKYDEAKVQLDKALAAADSATTSAAYVHYFLAMTEHHLGNTNAATKHLNLANTAADKELAAAPAWNRKLTLELLRKEAEQLIVPSSQSLSRPPAVALPMPL